MHQGEELAHVIFPLEVNDGWPPVSAERVWAEPLGSNSYRIANAPWFVTGISEGDIVRAFPLTIDSHPVYSERLQWSGNYTVRVIPTKEGPLQGDVRPTLEAFKGLGVTGEIANAYRLVAITISADADLGRVKTLLMDGERDGRWHFEEGCIDVRWREA